MASGPFELSFDTIKERVIIDYNNLDPAPDTSQGSMVNINASLLSSMSWGLHRFLDWIGKQGFPDKAATEALNHWGVQIYGIERNTGENDGAYLNRLLQFLRQPPAGGNLLDFETWALDQDNSTVESGGTDYYNAYATAVSWPDGVPGTVGVYTIPNDETIIDDSGPPNIEELLRQATDDYIETKRPAPMYPTIVTSAKPQSQNVTMTITENGTTVNTTGITTTITDFIDAFGPGETLYQSDLIAIAKQYGAVKVTVTTPASEENTIGNALFYRAGTITVSKA